MMPTDTGTRKLLADIARIDERVRVRYSYLFCEICECNYRELLARFEDGSVFTLCRACALDLCAIVESFDIDVAITAFTE